MVHFFEEEPSDPRDKKIERLEDELDDLKEQIFILNQDMRRKDLELTEVKSLLGQIVQACTDMQNRESGDALDSQTLIRNLKENILQLARDYRIDLS